MERFTWPRVCRRLIGRAAEELDRLADALLTANASGQKVLAVAGWRRGEGATTLLAVCRASAGGARSKDRAGRRRPSRPRLAKRLGVQPQLGWNDLSADEGQSLDQAVVEATANNLASCPWRDHRPSPIRRSAIGRVWPHASKPSGSTTKWCWSISGPLENIGPIGDALARTADGKIDAVLLVHNQRITPKRT